MDQIDELKESCDKPLVYVQKKLEEIGSYLAIESRKLLKEKGLFKRPYVHIAVDYLMKEAEDMLLFGFAFHETGESIYKGVEDE